ADARGVTRVGNPTVHGLPFLRWDREEHLNDLGIELDPGVPNYFRPGVFVGKGLPVGTVRSHGIQGVHHRKDPGPERNLLLSKPPRVSGPIEPLLVSDHNGKRWL